MDGQAPKKKSSLGIVLAIVGIGGLLVLVVIGIGIYSVMSSEKGRAIVGMMGEAVSISAKAQKAPGTKQLRAMGCKQAMVMDMADLERMMSFIDSGAPRQRSADEFGEMVMCNVGSSSTLPCDRVASTYVGAVGPRPKPFLVNVQKAGGHSPLCSNLYDPQANLLKPMTNAPTAPVTDTSDTE